MNNWHHTEAERGRFWGLGPPWRGGGLMKRGDFGAWPPPWRFASDGPRGLCQRILTIRGPPEVLRPPSPPFAQSKFPSLNLKDALDLIPWIASLFLLGTPLPPRKAEAGDGNRPPIHRSLRKPRTSLVGNKPVAERGPCPPHGEIFCMEVRGTPMEILPATGLIG